jgi:hypothetical protein
MNTETIPTAPACTAWCTQPGHGAGSNAAWDDIGRRQAGKHCYRSIGRGVSIWRGATWDDVDGLEVAPARVRIELNDDTFSADNALAIAAKVQEATSLLAA